MEIMFPLSFYYNLKSSKNKPRINKENNLFRSLKFPVEKRNRTQINADFIE